jgi:antitoxin ParD1/3/4
MAMACLSECVRELIRADRDRQRLRKLLLDASPATAAADEAYFRDLSRRVHRAKER